MLPVYDPVDREVEFRPTKAPYDPRWMLAGRPNPNNLDVWQSGFFDRHSWHEVRWSGVRILGLKRVKKSQFIQSLIPRRRNAPNSALYRSSDWSACLFDSSVGETDRVVTVSVERLL